VGYEGTITDEPLFAVLGGDAETIKGRFTASESELKPLAQTLKDCVSAISGPERTISVEDLEVATLEDNGARRTFTRLSDNRVSELLG
jgi:proteasome alpha subunit